MRVDVSIKLVFFNIKIDIRDIIAYLKNNNFFYFRIWEKRKLTMILFNFELLMIMSISKQHNIKFVIMNKISDIKLVLLHIIFKSDVIDKKRFNLIDKSILKPRYSDIFFDSNSVFNFNFNFETSRKINVEILNLWHVRMNHLSHQNVQRFVKMFKNIDLIKKIVDKDLYVLYVIKKTHQASYKTHIYFKKKPLNLIHFDIYNLITFRDHHNDKYFIIFFDNWNKRSKVKIIK